MIFLRGKRVLASLPALTQLSSVVLMVSVFGDDSQDETKVDLLGQRIRQGAHSSHCVFEEQAFRN